MKTTEINADNLLAARSVIPQNEPIVMLNLLRYREHAQYKEATAKMAYSGRQAYYENYVPAFNMIAANLGIKGIHVSFLGNVLASLVVPAEEVWDDVLLVEYPNFATFRAVVESEAYLTNALPHRLAALDDWHLIAIQKQGVKD